MPPVDPADNEFLRAREAVLAANGGSPVLSLAGLVPEPPDLPPFTEVSAAVASAANPVRFLCELFGEQVLGEPAGRGAEPPIRLVGFPDHEDEPVDPWLLLSAAGLWIDSGAGIRAAVRHLQEAVRSWESRAGEPLSPGDVRIPDAADVGPFTYYGRLPPPSAWPESRVEPFLQASRKMLLKHVNGRPSGGRPRRGDSSGRRGHSATAGDDRRTMVAHARPPTLPQQIYRLTADPFQPWLEVADDAAASRLEALGRGRPLPEPWVPVAVRPFTRHPDDEGKALTDFPPMGFSVPVFSERAVDALRDLLAPHGEFLPLAGLPYVAFNVGHVIDALDEDRSKFTRIAAQGDQPGFIAQVTRFALRPEALGDVPIFRLASIPESEPFVTEAFRERARDAGLTGIRLEPVWPVAGPATTP
jgi:hypothetical protein